MKDPPTAIFAASDTQAIGIMDAIREAGQKIPEDISVMGYDDIEISEPLGLSTVQQHLFESGVEGVHLLLERMRDPERKPVTKTMSTELVIRRTTAPPPAADERRRIGGHKLANQSAEGKE